MRRGEERQSNIYLHVRYFVGTPGASSSSSTFSLPPLLEAPNNHDVDLQYFHHDGRGRGRGDVSSFNEVGFNKS